MRLLTQNVLNYPEVLESSRRSSECLLFFVISIDNDLITEKQLVPHKGVTEQLKGAKSNAVGTEDECDVKVVQLIAEMLPYPFGVILM